MVPHPQLAASDLDQQMVIHRLAFMVNLAEDTNSLPSTQLDALANILEHIVGWKMLSLFHSESLQQTFLMLLVTTAEVDILLPRLLITSEASQGIAWAPMHSLEATENGSMTLRRPRACALPEDELTTDELSL